MTKCPNCGKENKNTNVKCAFCETELNHLEQEDNLFNINSNSGNKIFKIISNIILIIRIFPWILIGILFIGISIYFTYSTISANNKAKNYLETVGTLIDFDNCEIDEDNDELCNAIYEYTVNDITYEGSPKLLSNRSSFKQTITVKYNPDNPSEYVINEETNTLLILGINIVIIVIIIYISVKKSFKQFSNKLASTIENDKDF